MGKKIMKFVVGFLIGGLCIALVFGGAHFFYSKEVGKKAKNTTTSSVVSKKVTNTATKEIAKEETKDSKDATNESGDESVSKLTNKTLEKDIEALNQSAGNVAYSIYFTGTDKEISNHNNEQMVSASVIKVFIMDYLYQQSVQGQLDLSEVTSGESLDSLIRRMIQSSDNEATNSLIDYVGMDKLNQYFASAGYTQTTVQRKMLDTNAQAQGLENYTSLNDTMTFLKKCLTYQTESPYSEMLTVMKGQQINTKIRRLIPEGVQVANKTGELGGVDNDIGIIFSDHPVIISVLTNNGQSPETVRQAISQLSLDAYELSIDK